MPYFVVTRLGFVPTPFVRLLLLSLWLTTPLLTLAQGRAAVSGTVTSPSGAAVEFATVTLHRAADSVVVKTEFSDPRGAFQLDGAAGGRYRVSVAQVGFERYWSPVFELPTAGMTLPTVTLTASAATALKEVTVKARKPLFERQADRTVVNVADSPLSAGTTTLDVLGRSPGVTVDASDNLSLRGRQGLLVVIDGKRQPMTGSELADYLRALPAEQLQSIELITNPPAQYDAQGGAGVIAINLKKDQRQGTNGSVNASYGRGEYGKFTGGFALNHRHKKVNAYGNYAYTDRRGFVRLDFNRRYFATPQLPESRSVLANKQLSHLLSHSGKLGLDIALSKRTLVGVALTGLASQTDADNTNDTQFFGANGERTDHYTGTAASDIDRPNGAVNLNLRHTFADSATAPSLTFDADYARYHTTRLLALNTYYHEPARPATLLSGDQRSKLSIGALKADFSWPLPHRARLETGVKVTQVTSDNNVAFYRSAGGPAVFDPLLSSQFSYRENVNAAYVNLRGTAPGMTLQAGLRAEQTNTRADLSGEDSRTRHYLQLFPSATVGRTLNARHALALAVARRIDRPSYAQLNPLRSYLDATSYSAGNRDLVAQTSYNVELTHTYRQKFSTALSYARTSQPLVLVVQPSPDGGRLVVNRTVNLTTQHFYSLTLTAPLELTKWWTLYANGVFYYSQYVGNLVGTNLNRGRAACNLTANSSFTLPNGWSADLNGLYESREVEGFQLTQARGQVAAGLQKNVWGKQGTLRVNVADIFYTTPIRATSTYDNFTETFYRGLDNRVVTAAFTYRFGNSKVAAARKRAAGADDELRRAAGQ
ncbi:TonB-dependent receptor [Hymenobacter sp. BT664]|uniref:TonB-dependent receptor n=1 Tax=Hymenobacter montanus TaxID=2771359 RepID=A0A927BDF1_9BACT|nr:TonB-dependent receptor [Hymenobacter montanus]MBD2767953.1 TonB-dependent receptor [Hymenobacter montanus]